MEMITIKNKKMKRILLFACGLFLFGMASQAQSTDSSATPHHRMERRGGRQGGPMMGPNSELVKKLNLTADQQAKLKTIREDLKTQSDAVKNNSSLSEDQKKAAFRDLFKKSREAQDAVYTDEQKEILKKAMQERRQQRGNRNANAASGNGQ